MWKQQCSFRFICNYMQFQYRSRRNVLKEMFNISVSALRASFNLLQFCVVGFSVCVPVWTFASHNYYLIIIIIITSRVYYVLHFHHSTGLSFTCHLHMCSSLGKPFIWSKRWQFYYIYISKNYRVSWGLITLSNTFSHRNSPSQWLCKKNKKK